MVTDTIVAYIALRMMISQCALTMMGEWTGVSGVQNGIDFGFTGEGAEGKSATASKANKIGWGGSGAVDGLEIGLRYAWSGAHLVQLD